MNEFSCSVNSDKTFIELVDENENVYYIPYKEEMFVQVIELCTRLNGLLSENKSMKIEDARLCNVISDLYATIGEQSSRIMKLETINRIQNELIIELSDWE